MGCQHRLCPGLCAQADGLVLTTTTKNTTVGVAGETCKPPPSHTLDLSDVGMSYSKNILLFGAVNTQR